MQNRPSMRLANSLHSFDETKAFSFSRVLPSISCMSGLGTPNNCTLGPPNCTTLSPPNASDYMVVSLNYCSQNGGNLCRAPYYNGNPNIGPRIIGNLDQYPHEVCSPNWCNMPSTAFELNHVEGREVMCIARVVDSDAPPQSLVCMAFISKLLGKSRRWCGHLTNIHGCAITQGEAP